MMQCCREGGRHAQADAGQRAAAAKILLGKVIGGTVTLLVPFIVALIWAFSSSSQPRLAWSGSDWIALGALFVGAALYVFFLFRARRIYLGRHSRRRPRS